MVAVVPDVRGGSGSSLEVVAVVPDVGGVSGNSLEVVSVVPDIPGGKGRSLEHPQLCARQLQSPRAEGGEPTPQSSAS